MKSTIDSASISETASGWLQCEPAQLKVTPAMFTTIRAKFICRAKEETLWNDKPLYTVKLYPVGPKFTQNPQTKVYEMEACENTAFWHASPVGSLELGSVDKAAADFYQVGKEYFLDFTAANPMPAAVA